MAQDKSTPELIPQLENSGQNKTVVFEKDDFVPVVKRTLADYLVNKTQNNDYSLKDGMESFSLHNSDGTPADLSRAENFARKTYIGSFLENDPTSIVPAEFEKYSNSGFLDTKDSSFAIKKGKSNKPLPSGHELFRDLDAKRDNSQLATRIQTILKEQNIFNDENPFIGKVGLDQAASSENDNNVGIGIVQKEFGVHYPRKDLNAATSAGLVAEKPTLLKIKELKKIGALMMLKGSGEVYIPKNPADAAEDLAARGSTLVPGLARVGQKIGTSKFSARNIMTEIDANFAKPSLDNTLETKEVYSYGSPNNYLVPFSGLSSTSSIAGAGILITVVSTMLKAISLTIMAKKQATSGTKQLTTMIDTVSRNSQEVGTVYSKRRKRLGAFVEKAGLAQIEVDTAITYYDYFKCVNKGIDIFFGFNGTNFIGSIGTGLSTVSKNHTFYNVLLRNIIRSTTDDFVNSFGVSLGSISPGSQIGTANPGFAKENVGDLGFPIDPLAAVSKLNNSTILKFVNILASIGDNALLLESQGYNVSEVTNFDIAELSDIDKIDAYIDGPGGIKELNLGVLHAKDRISNRTNALAWGNKTTPSMYWFPREILSGAYTYYGSDNNGVFKAMGGLSDKVVNESQTGNRISQEEVAAFEERLEAQYMPFYFHDLRTNEIISFHAFLEDISEQYSADYEDSDGFGRIGKVMTYKNTDRSISLGFKVVATNQEDFDHMWWKINKLVSLVYPQYSEGRRLETGQGDNFIQPFSQVPTSSPMIRLRLGDIFKTNYSKFNLARLFGVSSPHFKLNNQTLTLPSLTMPSKYRKI